MQYFFHTKDGSTHRDSVGVELPDKAAARVEAIRHAGVLMADEPEVLWDGQELHVEVSDEHGLQLFDVVCYVMNAPAAGDTK
ncbi:MAG TPA: hypothetical protein VK533_09505 [Sphingomonas sp.]|uniref:DUF6894 family protein n=1 Tax=Sphingomonas sp. TaxID=28214 RepID=UPI002CAF6788|nr:hypothetical protein [Sphingomonas sp.]HMI19768.1 hypothetical protein [Sphingomonas sp.]